MNLSPGVAANSTFLRQREAGESMSWRLSCTDFLDQANLELIVICLPLLP